MQSALGMPTFIVGSLGPGSRRGRQRSQGGSCPGFDKFYKNTIHLRETNCFRLPQFPLLESLNLSGKVFDELVNLFQNVLKLLE
jgi:hypothetical protein